MPPPPAAPQPPTSRRPIWLILAGALALSVVAATVAAVWWTRRDMTVRGTVTLDSGYDTQGNTCHGTGGYADLVPGGQVTVTDAQGTVLAVGSLSEGRTVGALAGSCEIPWAVSGVPRGKGPYGVTVTRRGTIQYDEQHLAKPLQLTMS
jgi:hypothetical protein